MAINLIFETFGWGIIYFNLELIWKKRWCSSQKNEIWLAYQSRHSLVDM